MEFFKGNFPEGSFTYARKRRDPKQNPIEHLFELPEYSRYYHRLKRIVFCFLGMM